MEWCQRRPLTVMGIFLLTIALFGMWAMHDMVTFDAEGLYSIHDGKEWYTQWIGIDRWGFVLLKRALGVILINPYFSTAFLLVLFPLSALLWSYALYVWNHGEQREWETLLFGALYLSHPVWALQFAYRNQMEVMSVALALAPIGLLLLGEWLKHGGLPLAIGALAIAAFEFGCYQSFIFVYIEGVAIFLFCEYLMGEGSGEGDTAKPWRTLLCALCFVVLAFVLSRALSALAKVLTDTHYDPAYLSSQFQWGTRPLAENLGAVMKYIVRLSVGDGVAFTPLFSLEVLLLVLWLLMRLVKCPWGRVFSVVVTFGLVVSPFILEIATAGNVVARSQLAFVLAIAFIGTFEAGQLCKLLSSESSALSVRWVVPVIVVMTLIPQIQQQTRLLYSGVTTMDLDRRRLEEVYYQAMRLGAHEGDAVCFVGGQGGYRLDALVGDEVVGYSYFEHIGYYDGSKTIEAMRAYGLNVNKPTEEQSLVANSEAQELEIWPTGGSIRVHDGFYVVRLS